MEAQLGGGRLAGPPPAKGYEIAAIETGTDSLELYDWRPMFPVCVLFGNEVEGLQPPLLQMAETRVRIPMLGQKNSLNVATAAGVVLYEILRKYRSTQSLSNR